MSYRLIILSFLLSNCMQSPAQFPKIVDSIIAKSTNLNSTSKKSWEREVIYIGKYKNQIISNEVDDRRTPIENHYEDPCSPNYNARIKGSFEYSTNAKLEIQVDTNQIIKFSKWENGKPRYFNAYPLLIKNTGNKDIQIGYWYYIPALLEAKNEKGTWNTIEKYYVADCGTCMYQIFLKPNEILITTAVKYTGNFKTKLRMKIGENYSNEYTGYINKEQFRD